MKMGFDLFLAAFVSGYLLREVCGRSLVFMGLPRIRSVPGVCFGIVVILLALGNCSVGLYPYGTAVWVRPLFSLMGIGGAILLFRGNAWWRVLLPLWCLLQTWVIATDVSGEWFKQGLMLGWTNSHSVSSNNVMTEYEASGVNYAGLLLLTLLAILAAGRLHPVIRRPIGRRAVTISAATLLGILLLSGAVHWRNSSSDPNAIRLSLDIPGVPIYYKDQLLGRTPLIITADKVRDWTLPLSTTGRLKLYSWGWGDVVMLGDGTTHLPLYAGTPGLFAGYLDTFATPWGERCRMHVGRESEDGRRQEGYLYRRAELRDEPILTITLLNPQPVLAGDALKVRCTLTNPTSKHYVGRQAAIQRYCFSYVGRDPAATLLSSVRRRVELPDTWNDLPAGATMSADLEFDAPLAADSYEFFCCWGLSDPKPESSTLTGSCYSNMLSLPVGPAPKTVPTSAE